MVARILPQQHSCGTILEKRVISVDSKIFSREEYSVYYCPPCKIYKFNSYESQNQEQISEKLNTLQARQNLKTNQSIYSISYLKEFYKK